MSDDNPTENPKTEEERLRSRAADAFRYERPDAARRSTFESFQITPDQQDDAEKAKKDLADRAKSRFGG